MTGKRSRSSRPLRLGKQRQGGQRRWQAKLYAATPSRPKPRVVFRDPETGSWRHLTADNLDEANDIFDRVERWLDAGIVPSAAATADDEGTRRDLRALGERLLDHMRDSGARRRTIDSYERILRVHIVPAIGACSVVEWDGDDCTKVIRTARASGLAAATIQDIGGVLVALVSEAHRRPRWLPLDENPMEDVRYRAKARHQGQLEVYVPPSARPETSDVLQLCIVLWRRGRKQGRWWYVLMGLIAGFTGLRWSELIALRPRDYDADRRKIIVSSSIEQPDKGPRVRERTKNDKIREVPVTRSIHRLLELRCRQVLARVPGDGSWALGGPEGLLFPGPDGLPWERSAWRRAVFVPAARSAGWVMVDEVPTKRGLPRGGHPRLPWRNLRHHAATWLHNGAGLPWEEVSHILGHHSVAFTLDTYVRRGSEAEADVRARLDRF